MRSLRMTSTFPDEDTAEDVIRATLTRDAARIEAWWAQPRKKFLALEYRGARVIGRGVESGEEEVRPMTDAITVLKKDGAGGYGILTAYPKPRDDGSIHDHLPALFQFLSIFAIAADFDDFDTMGTVHGDYFDEEYDPEAFAVVEREAAAVLARDPFPADAVSRAANRAFASAEECRTWLDMVVTMVKHRVFVQAMDLSDLMPKR